MREDNRFFDTALKQLTYALSLPERTVRSLAALAGGASSLLSESLFPESLRQTVTYEITIGLMQRFVIEQVAGIERARAADQAELSGNYVQRKMAGTVLEAAGLLTMGFSPLWVLAIAGDTAGGSKVFLRRLVKHLKQSGVVAEDSDATELVEVLEAVQDASGKSATSIDAPPLSREELTQLANEIRASYVNVFNEATDLLPNLNDIWENMEQLSNSENVSIERIGGIMTMAAISWPKKGANAALSAVRTGVELVDENILDSYRKTLASAAEQGVDEYMSSHLRPFLLSARSHFDPARKSWTESKLQAMGNSPDEK
jgi:hypothetical protein